MHLYSEAGIAVNDGDLLTVAIVEAVIDSQVPPARPIPWHWANPVDHLPCSIGEQEPVIEHFEQLRQQAMLLEDDGKLVVNPHVVNRWLRERLEPLLIHPARGKSHRSLTRLMDKLAALEAGYPELAAI